MTKLPPLLVSHVWTVWATRGPHLATMQRPFGHFVPRAHPRFFGPYLGRPNSDFESVFGLRTVTPSHTTTTIQL